MTNQEKLVGARIKSIISGKIPKEWEKDEIFKSFNEKTKEDCGAELCYFVLTSWEENYLGLKENTTFFINLPDMRKYLMELEAY